METEYNQYTGELKIVMEKPFSQGERAKIRCYGADDVNEGVAIMKAEGVDVSLSLIHISTSWMEIFRSSTGMPMEEASFRMLSRVMPALSLIHI